MVSKLLSIFFIWYNQKTVNTVVIVATHFTVPCSLHTSSYKSSSDKFFSVDFSDEKSSKNDVA